MLDVKVTKTTTITTRSTVAMDETELEALLLKHFSLPQGTEFKWRTNRYGDFEGVEIIHETEEVTTDED